MNFLNFTEEGYTWSTNYDIVNLQNGQWEKVNHTLIANFLTLAVLIDSDHFQKVEASDEIRT